MKKILLFLAVLICFKSMGQKPWKTEKPTGQVTQIHPGQVIKEQEMVKEAVKSQAEKQAAQAAIDKVLNATVKRADFIIRNYTRHAKYVFGKLSINLDGNNDSKFELYADLKNINPIMNNHEDLFEFHGGPSYKDLLQNGFVFKAAFSDRLSSSPIKPGQSWGCNFFISFLFMDGTKVEIPLQDFVIGNKTMWESKNNLIAEKNIPGSAFPDPANPLLPGVK